MRTYVTYIKTTFRLTMRDRLVLFFNYMMPLLFFIVFAQSFGADRGGAITQVITMVLILGVLGSGFFGAGLRAVQDREANILRRFKVAPITPLPILVSSLVTGLLSFLPSLFMILAIATLYYKMPWPERWVDLMILLSLGLVAFRSIGLIIASVVNTMQESQIIIQLLYLPMLFLCGATFPLNIMPAWLQVLAQFLPATYLYTGLQGILVQKDSLFANPIVLFALVFTTLLSTFLSMKLFRWEKDEVIKPVAKLWLAAVLAPFLALGAWQTYSMENVDKAKILYREMRRNRSLLVRGPRIFTGDQGVIASGAVLLRDGKIADVFPSAPADAKAIRAEVVEAAGKTLLPGLIDSHVHLVAPGGVPPSLKDFDPQQAISRALAAYLYSGVVAVKSLGDPGATLRRPQENIAGGKRLGAELFHTGRMFTTPGGHGTEYFKSLPDAMRAMAEKEMLYLPKTPDEARLQVDELHQSGAGGVKAILESGFGGRLFMRLDTAVFSAIADQARKRNLTVSAHTGDVRDVRDAVAARVTVIEHGSARELIPDEVFVDMAKAGVAYDPTLSVVEALDMLRLGLGDPLDRTLVEQVAPAGLIAATKKALQDPANIEKFKKAADYPARLETAMENLRRAFKAGVTLVAGTDSGNFLLVHGPAIHRELQLWVQAGIPSSIALQAATTNAANLLGIGKRVGKIQKGMDASLLLVDGNPLENISATGHISSVFFRGERVNRPELFDQK
jgi:imidazolonepropionase-like amidohydrolase/ABC-type multidrug transport system permease subunit